MLHAVIDRNSNKNIKKKFCSGFIFHFNNFSTFVYAFFQLVAKATYIFFVY